MKSTAGVNTRRNGTAAVTLTPPFAFRPNQFWSNVAIGPGASSIALLSAKPQAAAATRIIPSRIVSFRRLGAVMKIHSPAPARPAPVPSGQAEAGESYTAS